jgi:hypothetical protein
MDRKLLRQTGLSEPGLRAYAKKLAKFCNGLNRRERKVFLASMGTKASAMRSFHPKLTAGQLREFLEELQPECEPSCIIIEGIDGPEPWTERPPVERQ